MANHHFTSTVELNFAAKSVNCSNSHNLIVLALCIVVGQEFDFAYP